MKSLTACQTIDGINKVLIDLFGVYNDQVLMEERYSMRMSTVIVLCISDDEGHTRGEEGSEGPIAAIAVAPVVEDKRLEGHLACTG